MQFNTDGALRVSCRYTTFRRSVFDSDTLSSPHHGAFDTRAPLDDLDAVVDVTKLLLQVLDRGLLRGQHARRRFRIRRTQLARRCRESFLVGDCEKRADLLAISR